MSVIDYLTIYYIIKSLSLHSINLQIENMDVSFSDVMEQESSFDDD